MEYEVRINREIWSLLSVLRKLTIYPPSNHPILPDEKPLYEINIINADDLRTLKYLHDQKVINIESPGINGYALNQKYPLVVMWSTYDSFDKYYLIHEKLALSDKSDVHEVEVRVIKKRNKIFILTPDTKTCIHNFKTNSPLEDIFNYIYTHVGEEINVKNINFETSGYKKTRNLGDDIRAMGFNKKYKKYFFPLCTANVLVFQNPVTIDSKQLKELQIVLKTEI